MEKKDNSISFEPLTKEALDDVAGGFIVGPLVKTCPYCGAKSKNKKVCTNCGSNLTRKDKAKS